MKKILFGGLFVALVLAPQRGAGAAEATVESLEASAHHIGQRISERQSAEQQARQADTADTEGVLYDILNGLISKYAVHGQDSSLLEKCVSSQRDKHEIKFDAQTGSYEISVDWEDCRVLSQDGSALRELVTGKSQRTARYTSYRVVAKGNVRTDVPEIEGPSQVGQPRVVKEVCESDPYAGGLCSPVQ